MENSVIIQSQNGEMVVSRDMRSVGYLVQCPEQDAHLYEIMPEDKARELEAQWKAEDEERYRKELEEEEVRHTNSAHPDDR